MNSFKDSKDSKGIEIREGDTISNGYVNYKVKEYKGELHADNGGHMFPLNSKNYNLSKDFKIIKERGIK